MSRPQSIPVEERDPQLSYYYRNKEKVLEKHRIWRAKNPDKVRGYGYAKRGDYYRNQSLKKLYKLTLEEWNKKFAAQGNCCMICKTTLSKKWFTDHNHETGNVRDILCVPCNTLLGVAYDDVERLRAAISYLERHRA